MPVKKDKKPILVKFSIAQTTGDKNVSVYGDWQVVYLTDKSTKSYFDRENYGQDKDFDLVILLTGNPITRQIDAKSVFLIDEYPTSNNEKGNYRIKKIFPEYLGIIKIGLESVEKVTYQNLYYLDGEKIYKYQLNYDRKTKVGYIDKDINHPFSNATTIWSTEPKNSEDTKNRIVFKSQNRVGIVERYKSFIELVFGDLE